jgi:epoxyqueuosine reductase QueG
MEQLTAQLESLIKNLGASFVGFSNVTDKLPENLKQYPYAVSFGIRLSDAIVDEIDDKPTFTYFNHYRSINSLIDSISLRAILFLQNNGFNAYSVAASQSIPTASVPYSGVFPHKTAAVSAGLGWIGKSALFIHNEFGPRVRLGTVLTDMPLPSEKVVMHSKCSACNKCVSACPAMAIRGGEWNPGVQRESLLDAKACSEYMSIKFKHIGRGSVCGICMRVCPHKKR